MKGDIVYIQDLQVETVIGVFAWERKIKQKISLDLEMVTDIRMAAETDQIANTLDYKKIAKATISLIEENQFQLIETFAEAIAKMIIKTFDVQWLKLRISKPGAIRKSKDVGLIIERAYADYAESMK